MFLYLFKKSSLLVRFCLACFAVLGAGQMHKAVNRGVKQVTSFLSNPKKQKQKQMVCGRERCEWRTEFEKEVSAEILFRTTYVTCDDSHISY